MTLHDSALALACDKSRVCMALSESLLPLQQFLEREHCEENILFYKDTQEFSEKAQQMTSVQMQATAKKIYDQYLSPSSPHTVNVDDRALKAVESTLDSPAPSLFAEAQEQVLYMSL